MQITRITIKTWMSLNLCQIQPLTTELAAIECPKIQCLHFFSVAIDLMLFKLADKEEMHTNLDLFDVCQIGQQKTELAAFEHPKIP